MATMEFRNASSLSLSLTNMCALPIKPYNRFTFYLSVQSPPMQWKYTYSVRRIIHSDNMSLYLSWNKMMNALSGSQGPPFHETLQAIRQAYLRNRSLVIYGVRNSRDGDDSIAS